MGFVRDAANVATFGLLGNKLLGKKKKEEVPKLQPTMISTTPYERPISLIGTRGGR